MKYKVALIITIIMSFSSNALSDTTSNSYLVNALVPIGGTLSRYVQITGAPSNAVITNVEAMFSYTAYGVVQDYVSCRFNRSSDPGPSGGAVLVSQGNLPAGNPGTYGYVSFSNWNGQAANANYYFRFQCASGSPYDPTIDTIYVRVTYNVPPPAPALYSPSDYHIKLNQTPHSFDWSSPSGATGYRIYVDNNSGFGTPEINEEPTVSDLTSNTSLADNVYYWKVQARNSSGQWSDWSETRSFVVDTPPPAPSLSSPADGTEYDQGDTAAFSWSGPSGYSIDRYYIRIVKGTDLNNSPEYEYEENVTSRTVDLTGWEPGVYTWGVRAIKDHPDGFNQSVYESTIGWGEYVTRTFVLQEALLPPPTLVSPINDVVVTSVVLQWQQVSGAAGYELEVDGNQVIINDGNQTSYSPTLGYGSHSWRARTKNSSGAYGDWSDSESFTYAEALLPPPTLVSPINDVVVTSVVLQWQQVSGAAGYELEIDGNQVIINDGNQTSYSPTLGYGSHSWRARTKNSSGSYGDWSDSESFTYSPNRYSISNGYIFVSGTSGYIDELKLDPNGSGNFGQSIIQVGGKLDWMIDAGTFSNPNTTIQIEDPERIVLDNQAGALWDIRISNGQFTSSLNLAYQPTYVQIVLDTPYEDTGYFDYDQQYHWEVGNNHDASTIPFKTFYTQTGNTRTIEYFMRNQDTGHYMKFRTNSFADTAHEPLTGINRLIAIGTSNFDVDFNNLPSHNVWIEKSVDTLTLCSGQDINAQTSNFNFIVTQIDENEGIPVNENGDFMPYFYTSANEIITNGYGGQYTFDELLNRFYRQSAFYYTDVGLNIWWNWASRYTGFVNNWYRNKLKANLTTWEQGDDGYGHEGYMWSWPGNREWPMGDLYLSYDFRLLNTNALFIQAAWNYYAWTGDTTFLSDQLQRLRDAMQYQLDWLGGGSEHIINGANSYDTDHGGIHNEDVGANYWDIMPFGGKDAYCSIDFYKSLEDMAQIEYALENTSEGDSYVTLAEQARAAYNSNFWSASANRYIGAIDRLGNIHDYGFSFVNIEALAAGLGDEAKASQIYSWLDSGDIYSKWRFAPRTNTTTTQDLWRIPNNNGYQWEQQLQDGGADLYVSGYDVIARAKYISADDAYARLKAILERYSEPDKLTGGSPTIFNETIQGGSDGPGSLGLMSHEFPESGIAGASFLYAFIGLEPKSDGLHITSRLPTGMVYIGAKNINYRGMNLNFHITDSSIQIECTKNESTGTNYYVIDGLEKQFPSGTFVATEPYGGLPEIEVAPVSLTLHEPDSAFDQSQAEPIVTPSLVDWSVFDTEAKDQGNYDSCWAFAATALIENLANQARLPIDVDFSEQVLVSCVNTSGYAWDAFEYVRDFGIPHESSYPYISAGGDCGDKDPNPEYLVRVTDFTPASGLWVIPTVEQLKQALQTGPLTVIMLLPDDNSFQTYSGGYVFDYDGPDITTNNKHLVHLVGYDDSLQCFKAKNSWGPHWGENREGTTTGSRGYFRIAYNDINDSIGFGHNPTRASGVYFEDGTNKFVVSNTGFGDLSITNIDVDKAWLSYEPQAITSISSNTQMQIAVWVNDWESVLAPSEVANFTIDSNDPVNPSVTIQITATPGNAVNSCTGDMNKDFDVDGSDFANFIAFYGSGSTEADLNNDSIVNSEDVGVFAEKFGSNVCP